MLDQGDKAEVREDVEVTTVAQKPLHTRHVPVRLLGKPEGEKPKDNPPEK